MTYVSSNTASCCLLNAFCSRLNTRSAYAELGFTNKQTTRGIVFFVYKRYLRKTVNKSNRCFKLELEWKVFSYQLPSKSKKVVRKRKKLHEIRKVARRTKSCSKSEKLLKSCRATYGQPYLFSGNLEIPEIFRSI